MNGIEKITLPKSIDDVTLTAVRNAKINREKNKVKSRNKKLIIAASITACLIISTANSERVIASIGNMMHKMETFFYGDLKSDDIKDYKSIVGVTKESNGVNVTLNEYFMDDENIYINARVQSRDGRELAQDATYKIFINGKEVTYEGSAGITFKFNNDNSADTLFRKEIPKVDLKNVRDIKIIFNSVTYGHSENNHEKIKGNWAFDFKVDGEKLASKVKNIDVNKTINLKDQDITIHDVKISPMKVAVQFSLSRDGENGSSGYTGIGVLNKNCELNTFSDANGNADYSIHNIMMDTRDISEITLVPYKSFPDKDMIVYKDKGVKVKIK